MILEATSSRENAPCARAEQGNSTRAVHDKPSLPTQICGNDVTPNSRRIQHADIAPRRDVRDGSAGTEDLQLLN